MVTSTSSYVALFNEAVISEIPPFSAIDAGDTAKETTGSTSSSNMVIVSA